MQINIRLLLVKKGQGRGGSGNTMKKLLRRKATDPEKYARKSESRDTITVAFRLQVKFFTIAIK